MELEEIKYKLTPAQHDFFYALKEYIQLPIYFIGSILRYDYFKGYSDLDVDIFSPDGKLIYQFKMADFIKLSDLNVKLWSRV